MQKKSKAVEIIKGKAMLTSGRLYWISDLEAPKNIPKSFYFNIDNVPHFTIRIWSTIASMRISDPSVWAKLGNT